MANGAIAVAVLIDEGTENAALETILKLKPVDACTSRRAMENFNPAGLLPKPFNGVHRYWTYPGSLTTPNCVEGVTFVVLLQRITASRSQLDALLIGHHNVRPVQPLGTRTVQRNF